MSWIAKLVNLGGIGSGYKTILGTLLLLLPQYVPGFPTLDISDGNGVTAAQILLVLASFKKLLEKFKKK